MPSSLPTSEKQRQAEAIRSLGYVPCLFCGEEVGPLDLRIFPANGWHERCWDEEHGQRETERPEREAAL